MSDQFSSGFSIGRVLSSSFSVLNKNIVTFGILSLILTAPNGYFVIMSLTGDMVKIAGIENNIAVFALNILVQFIFNSLLAAMLIFGAFSSMRGRTFGFAELLSKGLSVLFPVLGLSVIVGVIVTIGIFLLIVPGIILMIMFYVAIPVKVVEGVGIGDCMSRSEKLTKGYRWEIFGLLFIIGIFSMMVNLIAGLLAGMMGDAVISSILVYIFTAYLAAFGAVLSAIVYYELRAEKEGVDIEALARVFA